MVLHTRPRRISVDRAWIPTLISLLLFATTAAAQNGPSLSVSASAPISAGLNTNVTYSITATNNGPGNATGVTVTAILPAGFTFVPSGSSPSCADNGGTLSCAVGGLAAGASSAPATIVATATSSGTKKAVIGVVGNEGDPNVSDNSTIVSTTITGPPTIAAISPPNGTTAGGKPVTITGTNLKSGTTVTIGGTPASVTGGTPPTTLTATTGSHACGVVDVVVSNSDGTATLAGGYYYDAPPSPTGLAPNGSPPLPSTTTNVTLTWASSVWASKYAVRVQDLTDGTIRDPRNNCPTNTIDLCVDGVVGTSISVPVIAGHSYQWWLHAGNACQYSSPVYATFQVAACSTGVATTPGPTPGDRLWVDDQIPGGATAAGIWNWDTTQKASGSQSNTEPSAVGIHQHYFSGATSTLTVQAGEKLVAYVLLDVCNPPQEVMLQWNDGTWEHRAFWGQDLIAWGTSGTVSRKSMGALPATGQWVRLEVPVESVGLAGRPLNGMAFALYGGKAWFDRAGAGPVVSTGSGLYTVVPCRAIDTRISAGAFGLPALQPNAARSFLLAGRCAIPANAKAIAVNITVTDETAGGNLIAYPGDVALTPTSVISFGPGQTRANNAVIPVSGGGTATVNVYNLSNGTVNLIVDVVGYFQ